MKKSVNNSGMSLKGLIAGGLLAGAGGLGYGAGDYGSKDKGGQTGAVGSRTTSTAHQSPSRGTAASATARSVCS